jgi:hypothetical protein
MKSTAWPGRIVGDRVECGRQVEGRYVCQGILAEYLGDGRTGRVDGLHESPPGSNHWSLNARSKRKAELGGHSPRRHTGFEIIMPERWTRDCPHCGCVALIDATLLEL